ncbi:MAG TPA: O-antigen ligase family protein [Pilimelia sp.]|nr:O-antigen ligase family protein [Pilimelia sp.]
MARTASASLEPPGWVNQENPQGRWPLAVVAISVAAVSLPLLRPAGPGNTGGVDLALVVAMLATAAWASARLHSLRLPYAMPVALMVLAGAVAATTASLSGARGGSADTVLALAQDVFVFAWSAAVATLGQDRTALDVFCRAWAYSATAWAGLLVFASLAGIDWLSGVNATDGIRASFTLGDPNLAAGYFICGLLVMRATRRPRRAGWRWLACALVLTAIVLTLSNGGMLALLVATVLGALFRLAHRRGIATAAAVGSVLALAAGTLVVTVDVRGWVARVQESSVLVRDSLGRESASGASRAALTAESVKLWLNGDAVLGHGPGRTEAVLEARQAPYVKEAHDDYLAAIVERGVLGGFALVLLAAAVGVRCRRISVPGGMAPEYRDIVPRPELLAAAVVAVAISGVFYEVLHFRHVWALFGLVAALEFARRGPEFVRRRPEFASPRPEFAGRRP